MSETKNYIQKLFAGSNISIASARRNMFEEYVASEENINTVKKIKELQNSLMQKWKLISRIKDIQQQQVFVPNATVGKEYLAKIDFIKLGWDDIIFSDVEGLEELGLTYDNEEELIKGVPVQPGDFKIKLLFRISGEEETVEPHEKWIPVIINADPKSLWKNLPSNQEDRYWKEDDTAAFAKLGNRHIVVASKRGRSHANAGSFRDDDFAFKFYEETGWSVVAVSDGAGSAKYSRKGSVIACNTVVDFFGSVLTKELSAEFDALVTAYHTEAQNKLNGDAATGSDVAEAADVPATEAATEPVAESTGAKISKFIYHYLGNAAKTVHTTLDEFAAKNEILLKDLHSTLIFALYKQYEFGYVVLSFGVGDCPIGLLGKEPSDFKLMNWLDVGEFGGGTRFITMPEIFTSEKFATRFGFKLIPDFSYLLLMTDGIYDPKFVVEANLEKAEKWQEFIADLQGNNEDHAKVELDATNASVANELSNWMDFWSPGNHDDRTLAIVF